MTACRQNFTAEVENAFNDQINMELHASHVYLTIANFYDQDDVALKGFHKYFSKMSDEEREHARKMMHYQNQRGGRVTITAVPGPMDQLLWNTPLSSMQTAIDMEKKVNQASPNSNQAVTVNIASSKNVTVRKTTDTNFYGGELTMNRVKSLLNLHALSTRANDPAFCDFLEREFLHEQVKSIKELSDHITNLKRVGDGLGVFVFDRELCS